jgi:hypothetical protein
VSGTADPGNRPGASPLGRASVTTYLMAMRDNRSLTPDEVELARSVFGDAIDYSRVQLVRRRWWPFQPKSVVMAPTGNIYFHPDSDQWSDDFAREPLAAQGMFIHEMTHVWQTQRRGRFYLPLMRHPFCRYAYEIDPSRPFDRYGLEQQAEIVRHAFLSARGVHLAQTIDRSILPFA